MKSSENAMADVVNEVMSGRNLMILSTSSYEQKMIRVWGSSCRLIAGLLSEKTVYVSLLIRIFMNSDLKVLGYLGELIES